MFDFKPIVDDIVAQLTPQIADAVITRLKAEGAGTLALEPGALEVPFADLLDGDSHAVDKLKTMAREEARAMYSPYDDNEYLKPEFVTAVRDALQRIINY